MIIPMVFNSMTVIVANGEFPSSERPLSTLRSATKIICCDGAIENLHTAGIEPDIVVGDFDSISPELRAAYSSKMLHIAEQDTNDLSKAVRQCSENEPIVILGGTGLREDHALANIALLADFAATRNVSMISDYGISTGIHETTEFESHPGQPVSVFSFTPETMYTYKGLRYTVSQRSFPNLWCASLNSSIGNSFTVEMNGIGKAVVFRAF